MNFVQATNRKLELTAIIELHDDGILVKPADVIKAAHAELEVIVQGLEKDIYPPAPGPFGSTLLREFNTMGRPLQLGVGWEYCETPEPPYVEAFIHQDRLQMYYYAEGDVSKYQATDEGMLNKLREWVAGRLQDIETEGAA